MAIDEASVEDLELAAAAKIPRAKSLVNDSWMLRERAELKRDQILAFGPDATIASSTRSMRAIIEPAEG